jgi:hypothetical protein
MQQKRNPGQGGAGGAARDRHQTISAAPIPQNPANVKQNDCLYHSLKTLNDMSLAESAKHYCKKGFAVFPCLPKTKKPATKHGFLDASNDLEQVERWWRQNPQYNIAIPMGHGVATLDVDLPHGPASLADLQEENGSLPHTLAQQTGGGGSQYIFTVPGPVKNSTSALGRDLDVRGDGGYIVVPPSVHPATGNRYAWTRSVPPAQAPEWLGKAIHKDAPRQTVTPIEPTGHATPYAQSALEREVGRVATASKGSRNASLNAAAFSLGQLVAGKEIAEMEALEALQKAGAACGLSEGETVRTIKSGLESGKQEPRTAPQAQPRTEPPTGEPIKFWDRETREEPFPVEALPALIRDAATEYQSFGQQPLSMCACSALATVNVVTQGLVDVARDSLLVGPSSLFFLILADSGERKSALDSVFSREVRAWERRQRAADEELRQKIQSDVEAWKAERSGILDAIRQAKKSGKDDVVLTLKRKLADHKKTEPQIPKSRDMFFEDSNPAALADQLANQDSKRASLSSAEALAVTGGNGMSKDNLQSFLALLNKLWGAEPVNMTRKVSRSSRVEDVRFSANLMMQGPVFSDLLNERGGLARGCGMLARFLICNPTSTMGTRLYQDPPSQMKSVEAFQRRIKELLALPLRFDEDGRLAPEPLAMEPQAKAIWTAYHDAVERRLSPLASLFDVRDFAAKSAENAARLAATFQAFEDGPTASISAENMARGCEIAAWFLGEAQRVFGMIDAPQEERDAVSLLQYFAPRMAKGLTRITGADLLRLGPRPRTKKRRRPALEVLRSYGWISEEPGNVIVLNPAIQGVANELP